MEASREKQNIGPFPRPHLIARHPALQTRRASPAQGLGGGMVEELAVKLRHQPGAGRVAHLVPARQHLPRPGGEHRPGETLQTGTAPRAGGPGVPVPERPLEAEVLASS